jgi:aspartate aminotransferase
MSQWADVPMGPPDAILGLVDAFNKDTDPKKVSLSVGAYRDDNGKPLVLPSVLEAEKRNMEKGLNKEYAGIGGIADFTKLARAFALGEASPALTDGRTASVQTLSGTGACRVIGEFYAKFLGKGTPIYLPGPTWGNHKAIFKDAGLDVREYKYWDSGTLGLDLDGMLADLSAAPEGAVVLLHACAHNPTGVDPTEEQWKAISAALKEKKRCATRVITLCTCSCSRVVVVPSRRPSPHANPCIVGQVPLL